MQGLDSELRSVMTTAGVISRRSAWLVAGAATCLMLAFLARDEVQRISLVVSGLALAAAAGGVRVVAMLDAWRQRRAAAQLALLMGEDATPCFVTDDLGQVRWQNCASIQRFGGDDALTLVGRLHESFASPSAVLFRLQNRAASEGAAREDVVSRRGHMRLSVHVIARDRYLWRMEEFADRASSGRGAEGLSLPMVVANRAGVVLFSNEAMRRLIGERPKRLDRIFLQPRLVSGEEVRIAAVEGPVLAIYAEVEGAGDRREIFLMPCSAPRADERVETDFENVPVALMKFSHDGSLRAANRAAREMIGDQPGGRLSFHDLFEGLGRPVNDWLRDIVDERLPPGAEVLQLRRAGDESFVQVQLNRIVEFGRSGALAILSDATALKRLEVQFNQSQKMHVIGQLAGGVAHDFNNLLTAISGHCDLLLLRHDHEDGDYADLDQIRQNANRAASLVGQLLAFSRKQTLKPERLDLQELLSDLTHLLNRLVGERVQLKFAHDPLLGPVRADRRRLEQVLINLVVNARDAMAAGGVVRISTEAVALDHPLERNKASIPAGEYSVIRVADSGAGIPADRLEKIFEPFFTTKRAGEGTGLGLSTVYGIVKQSGGYVFVESELGKGTVFDLWFPVQQSVEADVPLPLVEVPPPGRATRKGEGVVLLVEDEAPVRAFACRALRQRGFTVLEAENAEQALLLLDDPALQVDVFVTDVVMPGLDGPSWVRRALEDRPEVRVVFVSGYAEESLSEDQLRVPNSVFLPKPFSLGDLASTVQKQIH